MFLPRAHWVLSGSLQGWGDPVISYFDLAVFLYTVKNIRLQRLRAREASCFGADAVAPGGWRYEETEEFIEWASRYDEGDTVSRTLEETSDLAGHTALPRNSLRWGEALVRIGDPGCRRGCDLMAWSRAFDDPIPAPDGRVLKTLHDAGALCDCIAQSRAVAS